MRISAAGNKPLWLRLQKRQAHGFTLLELLVVVSIIAIATAGATLALRDSSETRMEREAGRLAALLESARARSMTTGVLVVWRPVAGGFRFEGLPEGALPTQWLNADTLAPRNAFLELGPEAVISKQSVRLSSAAQPHMQWQVFTDGLRPFQVQAIGSGGAP